MAKYHFNVRYPGGFIDDEDGVDLPDIDRARHEAVVAIREIISEKVLLGSTIETEQFEITDPEGEILDIVTFRSVLRTTW
ncbi:DUF6894 family protein [Rhizobium tumorigenes]|uniref:DUF6894 domain-containing protein n=1 Tax=Rhizobium tumorigenes TaxID=2041385 RepID=A0AAF1KC70_9HYPH|nr:hypothetical protein [Rhizobium tumorigenes]WFR98734.1 hypothetical protein PR017_23835 [Rhizobium tumorigenes]